MERRVLIDDVPRKRTLLVDADMPSVTTPAQGELDFGAMKRDMKDAFRQCFDAFSKANIRFRDVGGWRLGMSPPCSGWWDYAIDGTDETGRLWFESDGDARDGLWYHTPPNWATLPVCRHSDVAGTMRWRGLNQPWPEGYRYPVPAPGRRARVVLL